MRTYNKHSLPRHVVHHSPDGFAWGYGGSGPSELARCLLLEVTGSDKHYQDFKWEFVASWDDSWSITDQEILSWVAARGS